MFNSIASSLTFKHLVTVICFPSIVTFSAMTYVHLLLLSVNGARESYSGSVPMQHLVSVTMRSLIVMYSGLMMMQSLPVIFIGLIKTSSGTVVIQLVMVLPVFSRAFNSGTKVMQVFLLSYTGIK